jgi:periplasmic protein TonB
MRQDAKGFSPAKFSQMATQTKSRGYSMAAQQEQLGGGLAGSILLHATVVVLLLSWAWFSHTGKSWGNSSANTSTIQATMVSSLPLPPKQVADHENVLATETPSPAPAPPAPRTVAVPQPDAIPIPVKPTKPVKTADKTTPPPPPHIQPNPPQVNKATTGEAPASIPMSSTQTQVGTFTVGVADNTFGNRFGYYNEQIKRKLESEWYTLYLDPQAQGHRVYITFQIQRDGTPSNIRIAQPSGDATLDQTSLSAVRHVDTFGPLPDGYQGSYVNVTYYFDPPPRH